MQESESGACKTVQLRQERAILTCLLVDMLSVIPIVVVALLSGSLLLLSDVSDYVKSFAVNGVSFKILREIRKGKVYDYDYGSGKIERVGSLFGAFSFLASLLALGGFSVYRLIVPSMLDAGFTTLGVVFQMIGVLVNGVLWLQNKRLADQTHSPLIEMQWRHKRTDALSNLMVVAALTMTLLFRSENRVAYIDPICSLAYVAYAIGSYLPCVLDALRDLMDHTLEEDLQIKIMRRLAEQYEGYEGFHGVRSRRAGTRIFIEIMLSIDPEKKVREALATLSLLKKNNESDIPMSEVSIVLKAVE